MRQSIILTELLSGRALDKPEIVGSNLGIFLRVFNTKLYNVGNLTEVIFMSFLTLPGSADDFFTWADLMRMHAGIFL